MRASGRPTKHGLFGQHYCKPCSWTAYALKLHLIGPRRAKLSYISEAPFSLAPIRSGAKCELPPTKPRGVAVLADRGEDLSQAPRSARSNHSRPGGGRNWRSYGKGSFALTRLTTAEIRISELYTSSYSCLGFAGIHTVQFATSGTDLSFLAAKMSGGHADAGNSAKMSKLKELLHRSENRICADCSAPDPKWASANIGVFICVKCSGIHRSLGTHISKVLSVTLDKWTDSEVDSMVEVGGNSHANAIYEAFLPEGRKPRPDSSQEEREKFIRSKYELQEFLEPSLRIVSNQSSESEKQAGGSSQSAGSKSEIGMVEFIGILNVKVIQGTNLAIRDMSSSDPYVVLTLGQQKAQSSVIKGNLNPIWNEELKLSVPQDYGTLKLQVFDHDMVSKDDLMGEAEIDLQTMINAAAAFGDPELLDDMQIGRWLKSSDNALVRDSAVVIAGGKVKQGVLLKLQHTESGELELEMEWMPLNIYGLHSSAGRTKKTADI
ncbi:hypothetical protein EJB05_24698, partial [Eragrostis curvula]